jgi:methionine sulfoxide reductase heme-binding subunit
MRMHNILKHPLVLWAILALPSVPMVLALAQGGVDPEGRAATEFLLHPTGEFSARFMIIAMMATPLRMLFPRAGVSRWLIKHRRHFGVAAFFYALFHTLLYVRDMGALQPMLDEFWAIGIWTGWLAMLIFLPLGFTSNDRSVRELGAKWKPLQRMVYAAAIATLVHWLFVHNNTLAALAHFIPLAALQAYRIWRHFIGNPRTRKQENVT